jgi:hypothetical protein
MLTKSAHLKAIRAEDKQQIAKKLSAAVKVWNMRRSQWKTGAQSD